MNDFYDLAFIDGGGGGLGLYDGQVLKNSCNKSVFCYLESFLSLIKNVVVFGSIRHRL